MESHFGMAAPESVERLYKKELGGGALLDIGVYPLSLIQVGLLRLNHPSFRRVAEKRATAGHLHVLAVLIQASCWQEAVSGWQTIPVERRQQRRTHWDPVGLSKLEVNDGSGDATVCRDDTLCCDSASQYLYEGEDPTEVHAAGVLKDGVDTHGSVLLKCATPALGSLHFACPCHALHRKGGQGRGMPVAV